MRHTVQSLVQRINNAFIVQHIKRVAGMQNSLFPPQHIGSTRSDQHHDIKLHDFHSARSRAHVASVADVNEDEEGFYGKVQKQMKMRFKHN